MWAARLISSTLPEVSHEFSWVAIPKAQIRRAFWIGHYQWASNGDRQGIARPSAGRLQEPQSGSQRSRLCSFGVMQRPKICALSPLFFKILRIRKERCGPWREHFLA